MESTEHDPAGGHGIADGIVYGPLRSRRYGQTLGINLLPPGTKRCEWNCVYCQLGYTRYGDRPDGFPSVDEVASALWAAPAPADLEALVVCGNGEPTMHPDFVDIACALREVRDIRLPGVRLVCLTNGQELWRPEVVRALKTLDETAVKLDAGSCDLLARVNVPIRPACVRHQIRGVKRLHGAVIQTCLLGGKLTNARPEHIDALLETIIAAMPERVDVYTLARPSPSGKFVPLSEDRLREIGARIRSQAGIPVRVFGEEAAVGESVVE